jgi:queuosine precursor transporter
VIAFLAYVATIVAANVAITYVGMVPVGFGLLAPAGVYCAGVSFTARDWLQESAGRGMTVAAIVCGALLSAFLSPSLALASGLAFLVSEGVDMLVYTPLRERSWLGAVALSNTVGLVIDSALFLYLAFGSLDFLAGNVVGKVEVTLVTVAVLAVWRQRRRQVAYA